MLTTTGALTSEVTRGRRVDVSVRLTTPEPDFDAMGSRHRRYLEWTQRLRHQPRVPAGLRASRFCAAAALITGPGGLGLLRRWPRLLDVLARICVLDKDAMRHLEAISETLFERNAHRLGRALRHWHGSDTTSAVCDGTAAALAFDEAMVAFDQQVVEDYLGSHRLASSTRCSIDRLLAACTSRALGAVFGIDPALSEAVRAQRRAGGGRITFFSFETRVAIGWRLVRLLSGQGSRFDPVHFGQPNERVTEGLP